MLKRFPIFTDILQVYSFTAFFVYGRMLYVFAWKIPSFILNLILGEILSILAYALAIALLETTMIASVVTVIAAILPAKWLRAEFITRGVWLITVWFISWIIYFSRVKSLGFTLGLEMANYVYPWIYVTLTLAALAAFLSTRIRFMRTFATWFADRTQIFLFIFIPASLVGAIVMLIRTL